MLHLERHRLGPRVYICGLRIHEFALGLAVITVLVAGGVAELWELTRRTEVAALVGTWLVGKDWRDLVPSKRNTAAWGLLRHRVPPDQDALTPTRVAVRRLPESGQPAGRGAGRT